MLNLINISKIVTTLTLIYLAITPKLFSDESDVYKQLNLFGEVYERVRSEYVEKVSDKDLIEAAINGMLQSLDPHSSYLNADSFSEMKIQTKGEFGGLGIEVTMENGLVKVVSPIDDTPAAKAGLQSGDYISHIDEEAVMGLTLSEAVDKMRGPINTELKITVIREGQEAFDLKLKRAIIKVTSIKAKKEEDVAYIRITSFTQKTFKNLIKEYNKLSLDMKDNLKGLVLDLRDNGGGSLQTVVDITGYFIKTGPVVQVKSTGGKKQVLYASHVFPSVSLQFNTFNSTVSEVMSVVGVGSQPL